MNQSLRHAHFQKLMFKIVIAVLDYYLFGRSTLSCTLNEHLIYKKNSSSSANATVLHALMFVTNKYILFFAAKFFFGNALPLFFLLLYIQLLNYILFIKELCMEFLT